MKRKYTPISRLLTVFVMLFIVSVLTLLSQTPTTFNYQAVLRDTDGNPRSGASVSIVLDIHQSNETGTIVYSETHSTTTSDFGIVNLEIGSVNAASFATIDWSAGPYFVEVSVDGTSMGVSELLTVPYALYAVNGVPGPQGPQGDPGPQGIQGEQGPAGIIEANTVESIHVIDNSLTADDLAPNSVTASEIEDGTVGAAEIATGAVGSSEVLNGSLSHVDLSDAAGVEFESLWGDVIPLTASELLSITVDAPSSGYVIVMVTGWVNWYITTLSTYGWCNFGISSTSGEIATNAELAVTATESISDYYKIPISVSKVFEVSAGANTFYFNGYRRVDIGTVWLAANMIGIYVPTRY